ncbi:MAG: hypothetical protein HDS65_03745 [Bacteroidales bacterium]|nr:hypothetical protein [Bacteroidales bacterium]
MKKFLLFTLLAGAAISASAAVGSGACQPGYHLTNVYSLPGIMPSGTTVRSAVGTHDKWFVNEYGTGIKVYDSKGTLITTIKPSTGHYLWVSGNIDHAGHYLPQVDNHAFNGTCSADGHGFMVIDTETNEVLKDFVPMGTMEESGRFDCMAPVLGNIFETEKARIYAPLNTFPRAEQFTYNWSGSFAEDGKCFKAVSFDVPLTAFPAAIQKCTSTGYAMQYTDEGQNFLALYGNPHIEYTYSAAGKYGNGIAKYAGDGNYKPTGKYFYTPQHSCLSGFNIFNLQGDQYIIYPGGGATRAGDAFAIARLTEVDSPLTDMSMEGESGLAGPLVARAYAATSGSNVAYVGNTAGAVQYTVEEVEGEPYSAYIYVATMGTPLNKWKFSVPDKGIATGVEAVEVDSEAPVEYYNLQGVRVANPEKGIYIKRQGATATKVVF